MPSSWASRWLRSSIRSLSGPRSSRITCPCGAWRPPWCSGSSTSPSPSHTAATSLGPCQRTPSQTPPAGKHGATSRWRARDGATGHAGESGLAASERGDPEVAELGVRFFNTYVPAALNQAAPTFASSTMNEYRRLAIGALEWRPDLSVEAANHLLRYGRHFDEAGMPAIFGAAAEDVADLAIEAPSLDPYVTRRLALLLVRNLPELIPNARPIGLNGLFKAVAKLTVWAMAADSKAVGHILVEGTAAGPPDFVDAALDRMEVMQNGLFWEVNERVVAFDWVEAPLRAENL